jgi:heme exporter protein D
MKSNRRIHSKASFTLLLLLLLVVQSIRRVKETDAGRLETSAHAFWHLQRNASFTQSHTLLPLLLLWVQSIRRVKETDAGRLREEYSRLVQVGLH